MLTKKIQYYFLKFLLILFLICNLSVSVYADYSNLIQCKDSINFHKREIASIKKHENRLKYYKPNTTEYNTIIKEVENTKNRFNLYNQSSLLCGKEGLPHLIVNGDLKHLNEFIIPGILFIYITGWIGWSGRKYLKYNNNSENSFETEIIINIPLAFSIITSGFLWPIDSWKELIAEDLLNNDGDITISPR